MGDNSARHGYLPVPDYIAFDLETTGLSPETDEILEVAMVRFTGGEVTERWSSLVNPGIAVPLKTLRLTHIDLEELRNSPSITELIEILENFRKNLPLVGHNSGFDSAFLARRIQGFPRVPLYDTLELARLVMPGYPSYKLTDLAKNLGVELSAAHRAYDDAEVSGVIFHLLQHGIGEMSERSRSAVRDLLGKDWVARHFFLSAVGETARAAAISEDALGAAALLPVTGSSRNIAGILIPSQPSLFGELEPAPVAAALRIADAPEHPQLEEVSPPQPATVALPRAVSPTGDPWETLASRFGENGARAINVPISQEAADAAVNTALYLAQTQRKRVLLLGFPSETIPEGAVHAGSPKDYVCHERLEGARRRAAEGGYSSVDIERRKFLAGIYRWSETTGHGCFGEIQWGSYGYEVIPEISCPAQMTCKASCPSVSRCFYLAHEARLKGKSGPLLAYAPLADGLRLESHFDAVFIWNSSDMGRAWQLRERRVDLRLLKDAVSGLGDKTVLDALVASAASDLASGVASAATVSLAAKASVDLASAAQAFRTSLRAAATGGYPVDPPLLWAQLHTVEEASAALSAFAQPPEPGTMRVVEQFYQDDGQKSPMLVKRAVWPARAAILALSSMSRNVVLLSDLVNAAAKTPGGRKLMGFDDKPGAPEGSAGAGQGGAEHGTMVISLDAVKVPSPQEYASYLTGSIVPITLLVRKGLFVAFPSRAVLKETYALVQPTLEAQGIAVYGQGIDGGRKITEHLVEDNAVVLGIVGSGPAPGDPVPTCLYLAKVPFAPPNPLDDARKSQIAPPANGFVEVGVRPSALAVRSYVEKMLASGSPTVLVLADPKVLPRKSSWGEEFMSAFADLQRLTCPQSEALSRIAVHLQFRKAH